MYKYTICFSFLVFISNPDIHFPFLHVCAKNLFKNQNLMNGFTLLHIVIIVMRECSTANLTPNGEKIRRFEYSTPFPRRVEFHAFIRCFENNSKIHRKTAKSVLFILFYSNALCTFA